MKIISILNKLISVCVLLSVVKCGMAIKCYQCSSDEDPKGEDNCGAYQPFDQNKNIAVECMGEEALTPGAERFHLGRQVEDCYQTLRSSQRKRSLKYLLGL
ncbi:unnamed protein product [Medioppia subpectinata]|uniref:Protein quiver n=1 Tax=Medioppia subpectinata TaxID=1979941 RepID=A0A7R9L4Q1_9ACAR|nr:unnamed protein product [Medioppia subpectinata]CAG2115312.1 unnamed protein product [Medioppia subpectinata]